MRAASRNLLYLGWSELELARTSRSNVQEGDAPRSRSNVQEGDAPPLPLGCPEGINQEEKQSVARRQRETDPMAAGSAGRAAAMHGKRTARKRASVASRKQPPATVRQAVMAYVVWALLAGRVQVRGGAHAQPCALGYEEANPPCTGSFYLSTDTAGGHKDAVLWADTWYGQALVSRNNAFRALLQSDGNFVIYRQSDGAALWSANTHCQYDCSSATDSRSPNHGSDSHGTTTQTLRFGRRTRPRGQAMSLTYRCRKGRAAGA